MASQTNGKGTAKRGRRSIFTEEQLAFLLQYCEAYASLGRIKGAKFWNEVITEFFTRWPVDEPTIDASLYSTEKEQEEALQQATRALIKARTEQIKSWFGREGQRANRQRIWKERMRKMTCTRKAKPRAFTGRTMHKFYMKTEPWKTKVDDKVYADLGDEERKTKPSENVALWCKAAKSLWQEEPEDVKEEVCALAAKWDEDRIAKWADGWNPEEMTEEDREEARGNLAGAMEPIMNEALSITGCTSGIFIAGLPANEVRPKVACYDAHAGLTVMSQGAKNFAQYDPVAFDAFIRAFAHYTDATVEKKTTEPAPPNPAADDDPLSSMIPFRERGQDEYAQSDTPGASTSRTAGGAQDTQRSAGPSATNATGPRNAPSARPSITSNAAARAAHAPSASRTSTAASSDVRPSNPNATAAARGSTTATSSTEATTTSTSQTSQTSPAPQADATAPLSASGASRASSPSHDPPILPSTLAKKAPPRPRAKAIYYDVPAKFSSILVKDFTLDNAFRALLQRMPPSAREGRLQIMGRWPIWSFKRANSLAQQNAQLGASTPARDRATMKEIFQNWEPTPSKSSAQAQSLASKRKLSAREEEEADYEEGNESESGGNNTREGTNAPRTTRGSLRRAAASAQARAGASSDQPPRPTQPQLQSPPPIPDAQVEEAPPATPRVPAPEPAPRSERERSCALSSHPSPRSTPQLEPPSGTSGDAQEDGDHPPASADEQEDGNPRSADSHPPASDDGGVGLQGIEARSREPEQHARPHRLSYDPRVLEWSVHDMPAAGEEAWIALCYDNVDDLDDAEEYEDDRIAFRTVVKLWAEIEETNNFKEEGNPVTTQHRPTFVSAWIGRARRTQYVPDLLEKRKSGESEDDAANAAYDDFRDRMRLWWHAINPDWRKDVAVNPTFALPRRVGDWSSVYCPGKRGLINVVKCLKWWWDLLQDVDEEEGDRDAWRDAVDDVAYVFEEVLEQQRFESALDITDEPPSKRRRT